MICSHKKSFLVKKIQFSDPLFVIVLSHFSCFDDGTDVSRLNTVAQNCQKIWGGTVFNNIKFFIFPFTSSSCVARTQKVKNRKCVAMQSICYWYMQLVAREDFLFLDRACGPDNINFRLLPNCLASA